MKLNHWDCLESILKKSLLITSSENIAKNIVENRKLIRNLKVQYVATQLRLDETFLENHLTIRSRSYYLCEFSSEFSLKGFRKKNSQSIPGMKNINFYSINLYDKNIYTDSFQTIF